MNSSSEDSTLSSLIFILIIGAIIFLLPILLTPTKQYFGTVDFLEYWSAYQVTLDGGNPYNATEIYARELQNRPELTEPLMMWNPPWLLLLMAPILQFDFNTSAHVFSALNIAFYLVSLVLLSRSYRINAKSVATIICISLIFCPFWETLASGQVSIFLLLGLALLAFASETNHKYLLEAVGLSLLTVKPHIAYLVFVAFILKSLKHKDAKGPICFVASLLVLAGITEILYPNLLLSCISASINPKGATPIFTWKPMSLVTPIAQIVINHLEGKVSIRVIVLAVAVILMALSSLIIGIRIYKQERSDWKELLPLLTALSCLTFPHGWLGDYVVLAAPQMAILAYAQQAKEINRYSFVLVVLLLLANQGWNLYLLSTFEKGFFSYFCFPIPYLVLAIILPIKLRRARLRKPISVASVPFTR